MTTTDLTLLHDALKREWCETFEVYVLPNGSLSIATPFTFGDGDVYPIIIEQGQGGWRISDHGYVVSHFQHDEFSLTEPRRRQVERFAEANGMSLDDNVLTRTMEPPPRIEDISDFIEVISRVTGVPLHVRAEPETELFRTRARERVISWLPDSAQAVGPWTPPQAQGRRTFNADLRLPAQRPVVAFFAAGTDKADRSIISVGQYQRWQLDVIPVLAHNGSLNSDTLYRAELALEPSGGSLVEVRERDTTTGYLGLRRVLADKGVELVP